MCFSRYLRKEFKPYCEGADVPTQSESHKRRLNAALGFRPVYSIDSDRDSEDVGEGSLHKQHSRLR